MERLSEKRLGEFVQKRRREIFLATKIDPRDRDGALRSFETSLQFLQTDYVDLIQIHRLSDLSDLDRIGRPDGVVTAIQQLKQQKVARFIGITGHNDGTAMAEALRRHDFDTVLMALNGVQSANPGAQRKMEPIPAFEQSALPVALQKNMGILSMKVMGQGMLVGRGAGRASPAELLQFNLSQPVACVVIGCEQIALLPPFELPRRPAEVDRKLTYDPPPLRLLTRGFFELLRFALPVPMLLLFAGWCRGVVAVGFGAAPLVTLATALTAALLVLALKWALLGRVRPGQHAFWSCWCGRWDILYVAWEFLARGVLSTLEGTLLLPWYLRAMGARIGRRVVLGGGFSQVVDPDMLDLGDGSTVSALFQAHRGPRPEDRPRHGPRGRDALERRR